jgi:hypothetical protein
VDGGVTATDSQFSSLSEDVALFERLSLPTSGHQPLGHADHVAVMTVRMARIIIIAVLVGWIPAIRRMITRMTSTRMGAGDGRPAC